MPRAGRQWVMPSSTVGGLEIAYEESGSGDPILFINGTGAAGANWITQTMELSERWRCVTPDSRDIGRSSYVEEPYAPADIAADMAGLADALGLGPCHVVGFSLGGAAAQELAIARPDVVRSLVLLSTWPATDPLFAGTMRNWQAVRRATVGDEETFWRAMFPWLFCPQTYDTPGLIDGFLAFAAAADPPQRPEGFLRQCDADIAHDAAARLGEVTAPALVLVGAQDVTTPARFAHALCNLLPKSELVTFDSAGHALAYERPHEVNRAIAEFLSQR